MRRSRSSLLLALVLLLGPLLTGRSVAGAQQPPLASDPYLQGMQLEQAEKWAEAARAYRAALVRQPASMPAMLGLERVFAQLGQSDSLLPLIDSAIALSPRERGFRSMQLRTLSGLGGGAPLAAAFDRWRRDWPHQAAPYQEYARILIQSGRTAEADSVLQRARLELGSARGLQSELAQLQASAGAWPLAAQSWRESMSEQPYLEQAAVFSLVPVPAEQRDAVRTVLLAPPLAVAPRRILAGLELAWGSARDAWAALAVLPPDRAGLTAWQEFSRQAEEAGAWLTARDALAAVFARRRDGAVAARAASDALAGGDAASALALSTQAEMALDSGTAAGTVLPIHVQALSALARPAEAEVLLDRYGAFLRPAQRQRLLRALAWGWVRTGDIARAERTLAEAGDSASQGEASAWLALFRGDLATARKSLTVSAADASPDLVTALALLARTQADSAPLVGAAFLALAQGDSVRAAAAFEQAAVAMPEAATLLDAAAARIAVLRHDDPKAIALWSVIAERYADSPEAPEANLEWARALRRAGNSAAAIDRLEHLILTYPRSALLPQARRELDQARAAVPPTP